MIIGTQKKVNSLKDELCLTINDQVLQSSKSKTKLAYKLIPF